jgi:hypothetical protein
VRARGAKLPDPRRYGSGADGSGLLALAQERERGRELVRAACEELLAQGAEDALARALAAAPSREAYERLWEAVCEAAERPRAAPEEPRVQLFAMPWVLVCGAREAAQVPGALREPQALARTLEEHGALGPSRNVGFGAALCSFETLAALPATEVYRAVRSDAPTALLRALAPEPVVLEPGAESVHLRFLLGAAVAPAHAPSIVETAGNIAAWGLALTRAMSEQLSTAGAQLLPLPRPPLGLLRARHAGRRARLEIAFQLYFSNAVRRFRLASGDPDIVVSAHELAGAGAEVRVSLSSRLDQTALEGFRWPLHPLDDLDAILACVRDLARDCRLGEPLVVERALPERDARGALFVRPEQAL